MSLRSSISRVFAQPRSWFRASSHRERLESEMDAELAAHLENLTADLIRAGHSPQEAARHARIAIGPLLAHKEEMRASLGLRWGDELHADLRYALRMLRKSPGFTAIATLSLALAIGANTTIFSVAKSLLYDRLEVPHADQLRLLRWTAGQHNVVHGMWGEFAPSQEGGGMTGTIFSYPVYRQMRDHNQVMQGLLAYNEDSMNATIRGNAQRVNVAMVSGNYFDVLGVQTQRGRPILPADDRAAGGSAVAVISEGVWEREFGRSEAVLGQTINVNQSLFTIVGVAPRGFSGAKNVQSSPDVFVPLSMQPVIDPKGTKSSLLDDPDMWWVDVSGRIKPGVSVAQAQAALNIELAAAIHATMTMKAGDTLPRLELPDGSRGLGFAARMFKKPVYVLLTITGLVLLLACANIANLLLARAPRRQREMSVRLALGANRSRLMRQVLTESLLLSALGGAMGLLLAFLTRNALPRLLENAWERNTASVPIDWGVFAFAACLTLLTGLVFGLAPAWLAARSAVSGALKESSQTTTRRRKGMGGKAIVAFQIALSMLLVVGAGLFLRTLLALNSIDVGFRTDHLILFEVAPPAKSYGPGRDVQLHRSLEDGFAALPGVESVTASWIPFIADSMNNDDFIPEGEPASDHHGGPEYVNAVGNGFFHSMSIPIVAGRSFGAQDTVSSQKVAIINQALAKKRFPNMNPVGKRFRASGPADAWIQIVGVCADTRYANLRDEPPSQFFVPYVQQAEVGSLTYAIRTQISPAELVPSLRQVVQKADRDLPMIDVRTQREQIDANMQMERAFAALTVGFGVLALALACVGIYGVMAFSVSRRTNEIGIRLALGALPRQVMAMVLREAMWLGIAGIGVGVGAALLLTRLVKSLLFGLQPTDPASLLGAVALLAFVGFAASFLPARRAAALQPVDALRHE